ncbi:VOC family protein [Halogranum rubrum]|uniref:Lactoylglutathione lyase-like lyase n=1 Tax=Halogranum salarium B-1 TaxID=1210908 RepID=J2ZEN1_9EURY|nr:VOC family protein [Halogranum salarium]EJN59130.1 lactoylglutathione lyase-like lyase [Halogranum salarium B-1]
MLSDTPGIHHVSAIASDPQRNVEFYTDVLGLTFVRRTVNFEDIFTYHLYYGDERGSPGSVLTFFAYPREVEGRAGKPGIHSVSLSIPEGSVDYWVQRLETHGVDVEESTKFDETVVAFRDPDGMEVELVTGPSPDLPAASDAVPEENAVRGLRGVSLQSRSPYVTASLLDTFGFDLVAEAEDVARYRLGDGRRSTVDILTHDAPYGREGAGSIHHVAFGVADEAELHEWRELLLDRDFDVSRVKDRQFMHSLYVRDPGGILFELATEREGVRVGDVAEPGSVLTLPPWLEADREMIEAQLPPLSTSSETEER